MSVTAETLAAAEALFGVTYSASERALMLGNLAPQIELAVRRRALALPAGLGPACRFDPRPPGFAAPASGPFDWLAPMTELPGADEDIAFAPIAEQSGWIKSGQLSGARLTEIYLARIDRLNGKLLCYATLTAEAARRRAGELDALRAAGTWLGPLHGIPYGMKDIIDTAGVETAWGAEPYQGRVPTQDAHVTTLLHQAGAVMLGKTSVGALAYGDLWHGGRTRNPWNSEEGASGSSAGSAAATAAGLAGFCIGTETLGSIISPATRCGTVGLRPTYGRVSRRGAMPLCWSLDKIGPLCRGVEDAALVLHALNAPDPADPFQIPAPFGYRRDIKFTGLRLGYYPADFADPEASPLDQAALEAAKSLGLDMVELERPDLPYDSLMALLFAEAAAAFEELTLSNRDDELTWQDEDAWPNQFRKARFLSAVDHVQADRLRRLVMQQMDETFRQADAIIGPSLAGPMLIITNFTGHPSLCLPAGHFTSATREPVSLTRNTAPPETTTPHHTVPHSISLHGRLHDEATLLALAQQLQPLLPPPSRPPVG